jgi:hypothetical protein
MSGSRRPPARSGTILPQSALETLLAGSAGDTLRRAYWLETLDRLLRPQLPPDVASHARLGNVRQRQLVFLVDAPVWHTRLRMATPALLEAARGIGLEVDGVIIKPRTPLPTAPQAPLPPPRPGTRQQLAAILALLEADTTPAPPSVGKTPSSQNGRSGITGS